MPSSIPFTTYIIIFGVLKDSSCRWEMLLTWNQADSGIASPQIKEIWENREKSWVNKTAQGKVSHLGGMGKRKKYYRPSWKQLSGILNIRYGSIGWRDKTQPIFSIFALNVVTINIKIAHFAEKCATTRCLVTVIFSKLPYWILHLRPFMI